MQGKSLGGAAAGAGLAIAGHKLRDPQRRRHVRRSARIYRLTARRSAHFASAKLRGVGRTEAERAAIDETFAIKSAEDVARELGHMKGVMMKAGQMVSFILEALPEEAQAVLATLQSDAPPMAPSLAESVLEHELGTHPRRLFLEWDPEPIAAASIGQVHRVVLPDGRDAAVKIQYPGIGEAMTSDLENADLLYSMFSAFALKSLDVTAMVDELRSRMTDELDYRIEARRQTEFVDRYRGHPYIVIPGVIDEYSTERVLTTEWIDGMRFAEFEQTASDAQRQHAAEILFRFTQGSIYLHRAFNGDPHPGNYLFLPDGRIAFLDFGLVKEWTSEETDLLWPLIEPVLAGDPDSTISQMEAAGFLKPGHGLDPAAVWEYVSQPYIPYFSETFHFTREYVGETVSGILDLRGPHRPVIEKLDLPPSFVILDRVVWGLSAILGRLGAVNRWHDILSEYRVGAPPATELGRQEAEWRSTHAIRAAE